MPTVDPAKYDRDDLALKFMGDLIGTHPLELPALAKLAYQAADAFLAEQSRQAAAER